MSFEHRPVGGDHIAVYLMVEALDIGPTARRRPEPLRDPRFVVDVNLGRLARLLRVLGFDVWRRNDADDQTLSEISLEQQRILLTRDRGLLKRRAITHGLFVRSYQPEEQALEVMRRLDLRRRVAPFTRCLRCNGALAAVDKMQVLNRLEPLTRQYYDDFSQYPDCGQGYWAGTLFDRLPELVDRLLERLRSDCGCLVRPSPVAPNQENIMIKSLAVGAAAVTVAMVVCAAPASATPGCESIPWGFFGSRADAGRRQLDAGAGDLGSRSSGAVPLHLQHVQQVRAPAATSSTMRGQFRANPVRPEIVLPDEPGYLGSSVVPVRNVGTGLC